MFSFDWSLELLFVVFAFAALLILICGTKVAGLADRLADRTGMGEAMTGATLLGASTSLPGITTSVTAAAMGYPELAISNAIGGIAAQTAFLAVADFFHPRVNLEHAAASVPNMLNGLIVTLLLGGILAACQGPDLAVLGVHPATAVLAMAYFYGLHLARRSHDRPLWKPRLTPETWEDVPDDQNRHERLAWMWLKFVVFAALMAFAGWLTARTGMGIARHTGLSESLVGGLFTAVATSTPELVTTIAAVRRRALTLAVGGILGGNAFDVMFAVAADVAYRPGSIYHAVGSRAQFLTALAIMMTSILVLGMVYREKRGPANIGFESCAVLLLYVGGFLLLALM